MEGLASLIELHRKLKKRKREESWKRRKEI